MSSLNPRMHSRNIYRTKPDFALMAKTYPSFAPYVKTDLKGKVIFDYNDSNALRELTKTLLKKDFGLEVDIPEDRLIPTVPQRLNYVLFVEDLVKKLCLSLGQQIEEVIGFDVGTGSVAIFPLLGCTLNNNWRFIAVDIDPKNVEIAGKNIQKNSLNDRIEGLFESYELNRIIILILQSFCLLTVVQCVDDNDWSSIVASKSEVIHFLMTNPPFFTDNFNDSDNQVDTDSKELSFKDKHSYHKKKSLANTSNPVEAVVGGGEVEFVTKIIEKSLELNNKVMIYTSMLGKKQSWIQLKQTLKNYAQKQVITSFVSTEFCQGNTKRWGIAWTLMPDLNLRDVPVTKSVKAKPPLVYYLPPLMNGIEYNMKSIADKIEALIKDDLKLEAYEVKENKKRIEFRLRTNTNVWSHQRRKRREVKRKTEIEDTSDLNAGNSQEMDGSFESQSPEKSDSINAQESGHKRSFDESESEDNESVCQAKKCKTSMELTEKELLLLDASLVIRRDKQSILIEMQTKELAKTKESTFQLLQYFKNKLV